MTLKKRLGMILAIAVVAAGIYGVGKAGITIKQTEETTEEESLLGHRETLYLWYTDEALTDYLGSVALSYSESQDEVRVVPVYTSGLEYLETINQASLNSDQAPDLYLISNDALEKAYLGGLASELQTPDGARPGEEVFPETAVHAVTYQDKMIAYPFSYETSCLLFNRTYLEDWARAQIEAEADTAAGEEAQEQIDNGENVPQEEAEQDESAGAAAPEDAGQVTNVPDEEAVNARVEEALPEIIDDILSFADVYDAPEQVEAVFKWDVSDIFYNYFFVGDAIDVGGVNGDQADSICIYNEDAIRCMRVYQSLNQFFSIDTKEISYAGVLQDFIDGKIVYTVATSDALAKIEAAKAEGNFAYDYQVVTLPDVSAELKSASLSVTQSLVVNGYSSKKDLANDFAVYLTEGNTDDLYTRAGKLPVYTQGTLYEDANLAAFQKEYAVSVPMPKMIETSNFWVELEIAFAKIWDGEDANKDLKALSEKIMGQVLGEAYTEDYLDVPVEESHDSEEGDMPESE